MEFYKYLLLNFNIKTTFGIISKEHAVSKAKKKCFRWSTCISVEKIFLPIFLAQHLTSLTLFNTAIL